MYSQVKPKSTVKPTSKGASNTSRFKPSGSSTQCNTSETSFGSHENTDLLRVNNTWQESQVCNSAMPLSAQNLEHLQTELMRALAPCPNAIFIDGKANSSRVELLQKPRNVVSGSLGNYHSTAAPLNDHPLEDSEWQDLLRSLEAEKKRTRVFQEMSLVERFVAYDRREAPLFIELEEEK